ncbi:MAG: hypothetical protein M3405_09535 [Acidobacteriota bacterium]|nr:hypothetical protein [Acidobacteriota bacterium]
MSIKLYMDVHVKRAVTDALRTNQNLSSSTILKTLSFVQSSPSSSKVRTTNGVSFFLHIVAEFLNSIKLLSEIDFSLTKFITGRSGNYATIFMN